MSSASSGPRSGLIPTLRVFESIQERAFTECYLLINSDMLRQDTPSFKNGLIRAESVLGAVVPSNFIDYQVPAMPRHCFVLSIIPAKIRSRMICYSSLLRTRRFDVHPQINFPDWCSYKSSQWTTRVHAQKSGITTQMTKDCHLCCNSIGSARTRCCNSLGSSNAYVAMKAKGKSL